MFFNLRYRSFQNCRLLLYTCPQSKLLIRTAAAFPLLRKAVLLDKSRHRLIYNFPFAKYLGAFFKSKNTVTGAAFVATPILYFLDETHVSPFITAASACIYFGAGHVATKVANNIVGKIYVNKEGEITEVMVSCVDEFGRRIDRIHKLEELINMDYPDKISRSLGFIGIGVEKQNLCYKVCKTKCEYLDESACDFVLGFAWNNNIQEFSESENAQKIKAEGTEKRLSDN